MLRLLILLCCAFLMGCTTSSVKANEPVIDDLGNLTHHVIDPSNYLLAKTDKDVSVEMPNFNYNVTYLKGTRVTLEIRDGIKQVCFAVLPNAVDCYPLVSDSRRK